ncbi:hypothetical protein CPC08DRAFT_728597 [Agrocybe pediades]|nr:hypothetical protein CPC08DRAFT_728597 [Agrocybe pediades]
MSDLSKFVRIADPASPPPKICPDSRIWPSKRQKNHHQTRKDESRTTQERKWERKRFVSGHVARQECDASDRGLWLLLGNFRVNEANFLNAERPPFCPDSVPAWSAAGRSCPDVKNWPIGQKDPFCPDYCLANWQFFSKSVRIVIWARLPLPGVLLAYSYVEVSSLAPGYDGLRRL